MRTLGFAGTAKNTGKTTTALRVLAESRRAGLLPALTSIGYDGENVDTITGLPKPRYWLEPGALVATAAGCLKTGAPCEVLATTAIDTILGRVVIARVSRPGFVLLAGPNRRGDLETVLDAFTRLGADLALLDGALNRLTPLAAAGGLILSSGAAFDERIEVVAQHAAALAGMFRLPVAPPGEDTLPGGSLLSGQALRQLLNALPAQPGRIQLGGACDPRLALELLRAEPARLMGVQWVFGSPLKLIAAGDPRTWQTVFAQITALGGSAAYLETTPLCCLTVNPFFPRYDARSGSYQADEVDKIALLAAVRAAVPGAPVVDIRQPPLPDLLELAGVTPPGGSHA